MLAAAASVGVLGVMAPAACAEDSVTTVTVIPALGESHFCKSVDMTALSGEYTLTKTVTPLPTGGYRVTGTITVSTPIQLLGADGVTYVMSDQGRGSWFDLIATNGHPTGTFANSQRYEAPNRAGFDKGVLKTTTTLRADGSQTNSYGGNCGQEPTLNVTRLAKRIAR
ncbi:MAG: hypothetical protein V9G19_26090 [Tetrasphaera sp.]